MFHFPQFPHTWLFYSPCCTWACPHVGFPIRTSPDLAAAHTSPELFAVYRVLRRHLTPQAFTVRPCSFSTAPLLRRACSSRRCGYNHSPQRRVTFFLDLFALTMHLVKSLDGQRCPVFTASSLSRLPKAPRLRARYPSATAAKSMFVCSRRTITPSACRPEPFSPAKSDTLLGYPTSQQPCPSRFASALVL